MKLKTIIKENIQTIQEARFDQPIMAFHGTRPEYLRTILSQGLVPQKNPGFGSSGGGGDYNSHSLSPVGGVYFTTDYGYAEHAVSTPNKLIVVASLQPKSFFADEDSVIFNFNKALRKEVPTARDLVETYYLVNVDNDVSEVIGLVREIISSLPNDQREMVKQSTRGFDSIVAVVKTWLTRKIAHLKASGELRPSAFRGILSVSNVNPDQIQQLENSIIEDIPRTNSAESDFNSAMETLTIILRKTAMQNMGDRMHTFRIPMAVGYRGNNKIVGVVEVDADSKELIVHYGTSELKNVKRIFDAFNQGYSWSMA